MLTTMRHTFQESNAKYRTVVKIFLPYIVVFGCLVAILVTPVFLFQELREEESISNFTVSENSLYFGGGYHLYRLDLSSHSLNTIFNTNQILIQQPIIADGSIYFGGPGWHNQWRLSGDDDTFFALHIESGRIRWRFRFDHRSPAGWRTWGTYPIIAGDQIIVCASQHFDCLNRRNGELLWHIDGWFGDQPDGFTRPYIYRSLVYYKTKNDGNWAVVKLNTGERLRIIPIAEKPGTYDDGYGHGRGALVGGVLYGATRFRRFGAIDLRHERLLWEFDEEGVRLLQFSLYTPAVNDRFVFSAARDSIYAFDRETGNIVWKAPLGEVSPGKNFEGYEYRTGAYRVRFAATNHVVIARGFSGVGAWQANTGSRLWSIKSEAGYDDADPLILEGTVILSCAKECRVFALDLETGKELWSVSVPDCTYYKLVDKR